MHILFISHMYSMCNLTLRIHADQRQAGRGSFVLPQDEAETRERLLARLDSQLDDAVATARLAGLDLPDLHERTAQRWTNETKTGEKPSEKE